MPPFEEMDRLQPAVYWPNAGYSSTAQVIRGEPVQIDVRWVWKRTYQRSADGDSIPCDAQVVTGIKIPPGSYMWLGKLADWYGTGSGEPEVELMQVVTCDETPDIKNRFKRYTASLAFYKDSTPPDTVEPPGDE